MNNTQYFKREEFLCPCCKQEQMKQEIVDILTILRGEIGKSFIITSGWRCEKRNKEVGGTPDSPHLLGLAIDFYCPDLDILALFTKVENAIKKFGWGVRIGLNVFKKFLHIDIATYPCKRWVYAPDGKSLCVRR